MKKTAEIETDISGDRFDKLIDKIRNVLDDPKFTKEFEIWYEKRKKKEE